MVQGEAAAPGEQWGWWHTTAPTPEGHRKVTGAPKEDLVLVTVLQSHAKNPTLVNTAINNLNWLLLLQTKAIPLSCAPSCLRKAAH